MPYCYCLNQNLSDSNYLQHLMFSENCLCITNCSTQQSDFGQPLKEQCDFGRNVNVKITRMGDILEKLIKL